MTNFRMALLDLLRKDEQGADPPFLRDGLRLLTQELMEAEVTEAIGAAPYEQTDKRITSRNGVPEREWDTRCPPRPKDHSRRWPAPTPPASVRRII
jgi:transposase-like protein